MLYLKKYVVFEEDRNPMKSSSGRLLGIDLQTKKNFKMQLDGEENNMAIATNDGKYLIAIKSNSDGSHCIRQYKLKSDKIVHEEIVAPEMGIPIEIYTRDEPSTCIILFQKDNGEVISCKYNCKEE
ncbi:hypothetical protein [Acetivibrio thermocellus]|mgnify:FL=1|uniref:hypothetical protein n=1 Tax=Acetivibrio thermocellus TaxID=1515 RepID=UPI000038FBCD|nr:hypothetical protein [Acetivibrio thermocellus]